jgi:iron complex outermembrane receptor protein
LTGSWKYLLIAGFLTGLLLHFKILPGQVPSDTLRLKEIEIRAMFPINSTGYKRVRIDSAILSPEVDASLATILSRYSTIFIKEYGNSSLATASFRGTAAHHTLLEWNGIDINSPMLGQIDLSLIPVSQFDGIEILYGAASLPSSGGAFGGIVNLITQPDWNNRLDVRISQTTASFHNFLASVSAATGGKNSQFITRAAFSTGLNDFLYYNDYTQTEMRQSHANYYQYGLSQDLFFKLRDKHLLSAKVWYNKADRDLPPTTTDVNKIPSEKQIDETLRSLLEYKWIQKKTVVRAQSALLNQALVYNNDTIRSRHRSNSWINKIALSLSQIRKLTIKPVIDLRYDWVSSDAYEAKKTRFLIGGVAEAIYNINKQIRISSLVRQDLIDGILMPFLPSLGTEYKPFSKINLAINGNVSRNYRYPTLNDLYWVPYGNPDLKPEQSYSAETGLTWNMTSGKGSFFIESEVSGYYTYISDFIEWNPVSGSSTMWKPQNIAEVLSRGVETGLNMHYTVCKTDIDLAATYNFCKSTYEKTYSPGDEKSGKQRNYVPEHTVNSTLKASYRKFYLSYTFTYVSRRFTGTDNLSYMPAYNLSDIFFGKNFELGKFVLSLHLEINNLFDLDYQSVSNRPMPGRNYALTVRGSFNNKSERN